MAIWSCHGPFLAVSASRCGPRGLGPCYGAHLGGCYVRHYRLSAFAGSQGPVGSNVTTIGAEGPGSGLTSATGLVIGSIIGTGVFTMPAVLAGAGTSSLLVLAVVGVGAMLLAVMFGQLTRRVPKADGGLYAYARHEFGDFAGYITAWCYWISSWAGNAAIVASWVFYVDALFGISHPSGAGELGHRADRPVGAGRGEPGRGAADGLVPERHGGAEVPAAAVRRRSGLVLRHQGATSARSTPPAAAFTAASASPPAWRCSPSSAWRWRR